MQELEARYGVSRTVIREVVKVLESLQIVTSRRRVGVRVRPRHEWNVFDPRIIRWRLDGPDRPAPLRSLSQRLGAVGSVQPPPDDPWVEHVPLVTRPHPDADPAA